MARKENKLRPYRVDFFNIPEMKGDRALVKSVVIRAVTAQQAKNGVLWDDVTLSGNGAFVEGRIIIRAYRYYKNTPANKEVFKAVEDLFTTKKAIEVMEVVEKYRALLATPPAPTCPYGYTKADEASGAMTAHVCDLHTPTTDPAAVESSLKVAAEIETAVTPDRTIDLDAAAPIIHPAPTAVTEETYQALTFPDHPCVPTTTAVFDDNTCKKPDCIVGKLYGEHIHGDEEDHFPPTVPSPVNEPFPGPTPLWMKLVLFGGVGFIAVLIVIAILSGH